MLQDFLYHIITQFKLLEFYKQCMVISSFSGLTVAAFGLFIAFPQYKKNQKRMREEKILSEFNQLGQIIKNSRRQLDSLTGISKKITADEAKALVELVDTRVSKDQSDYKMVRKRKQVVLGLYDILGDLEDFAIRSNSGSINLKMIARSAGGFLINYHEKLESLILEIQSKHGNNTFREYQIMVSRLKKYKLECKTNIWGNSYMRITRKSRKELKNA